jgi:hypothetical protein
MICDYPIQKREHHEVQHDRHDYFVRAESNSEPCGDCADDSTADSSSNQAQDNSDDPGTAGESQSPTSAARNPPAAS